MKSKVSEKEKAIFLRRKGLSYKEILLEVPVAKSTLSLWLQDLPLTQFEKSTLRKRLDGNISRGRIRAAASLRNLRKTKDEIERKNSRVEFDANRNDPFFQLGVGLYWAEGAKRTSSFGFMNSDPEMISVMIYWIEKFLIVEKEEIRLRLFTHKPFKDEAQEEYWSERTGIGMGNFGKTIYKPSGLLVKKRPNYKGCIRIELGKVVYLRKMAHWQQMLIEHYRKQR